MKQLRVVAKEYNLKIMGDESRRCLICNTKLKKIDKNMLPESVPQRVKDYFDFFQECPTCHRIFWHGDHYKNMLSAIKSALKSAD